MTSLSDGSFVVTWQSYLSRRDDYGIYGQKIRQLRQCSGSEFQISTSTSGRQEQAQVTALLDGGFVVALARFWSRRRHRGYLANVMINMAIQSHQNFRSIPIPAMQEQCSCIESYRWRLCCYWGFIDQDGQRIRGLWSQLMCIWRTLGSEFRVNTYTKSSS